MFRVSRQAIRKCAPNGAREGRTRVEGDKYRGRDAGHPARFFHPVSDPHLTGYFHSREARQWPRPLKKKYVIQAGPFEYRREVTAIVEGSVFHTGTASESPYSSSRQTQPMGQAPSIGLVW